jgi:hypothetical protein
VPQWFCHFAGSEQGAYSDENFSFYGPGNLATRAAAD